MLTIINHHEHYGVTMKKILSLGLLSLSVSWGATASSSGPDYATRFESARQQSIHFENKGEVPVEFDVTATITRLMKAQETQGFVTDTGFSYFYNKKTLYKGKIGNPHAQEVLFDLKGPDGARILQKRHITLASGEIIDINLGFLSYFVGLENLTGMRDHLSWSVGQRGLEVLLGVNVTNFPQDKYFVKTPTDWAKQTQLYRQYFLNNVDIPADQVWEDFKSQPIGVTTKKRAEEVIISLTSYPARFATTWLAIESLLRQEEKPDRIVLNLFEGEFPERVLPWMIQEQMKRGLEINWCPENLKVYLKVIPTIQKFPDAAVVAVDDDVIYEKENLRELYIEHMQQPHIVFTRDVRIPNIINNIIYPIGDWYFTGYKINFSEAIGPSFLMIPESVSMTLFPAQAFNLNILFNKEKFQQIAPSDDDLWLYASVVGNGTKIAKIARHSRRINAIENPTEALYYINFANDFEKLNLAYTKLVEEEFMKPFLGSFILHPKLDRRSLNDRLQENNFQLVMTCKPYIQEVERIFNSSIIKYQSKWILAHRAKFCNDVREKIILEEYDENFQRLSYKLLEEKNGSLEDPRLHVLNASLYLSYVFYQNDSSKGTDFIFLRLDDDLNPKQKFLPKIGGNGKIGQFEKNWLCFEHLSRINLIYSIEPLIIYGGNSLSDKFTCIKKIIKPFAEWEFGIPRSSIGPIKYRNNYYILFHSHSQKQNSRERIYVSGILVLDLDFNVLSYSKKPILIPTSIPFPANEAYCILPYGFWLENDTLFLTCGVNDSSSIIIKTSMENILHKAHIANSL